MFCTFLSEFESSNDIDPHLLPPLFPFVKVLTFLLFLYLNYLFLNWSFSKKFKLFPYFFSFKSFLETLKKFWMFIIKLLDDWASYCFPRIILFLIIEHILWKSIWKCWSFIHWILFLIEKSCFSFFPWGERRV